MKYLYALFLIFSIVCSKRVSAQIPADTNKKAIFTAIEKLPEFPGGTRAFSNYIVRNLKYPEVARLIGINGKVILSFVIDRNGRVVDVTPVNCIGAGCEAEAVKVLSQSPDWVPGIQKGRPVRVQYSVPINFEIEKGKVTMKDLQKSDHGFLFSIKGKIYTIEEAQEILGKSFQSGDVEIAEPFYNAGNDPRFALPDKKDTYLIKIK